MSRWIIAGRIGLQLVAVTLSLLLVSMISDSTVESMGYLFSLTAASIRPIWRDGDKFGRVAGWVVGSLSGLCAYSLVALLSFSLLSSGVLSASAAAQFAGLNAIIAPAVGFCVSGLDVNWLTHWVKSKWNGNSVTRHSLVSAALCFPFGIMTIMEILYEDLNLRVMPIVLTLGSVLSIGFFTVVYLLVHKVLGAHFFALRHEIKEGASRVGMVTGWLVGVLTATLVMYWASSDYDQLSELDILSFPVVATVGLLIAYVLVQAVFWAADGFNANRPDL